MPEISTLKRDVVPLLIEAVTTFILYVLISGVALSLHYVSDMLGATGIVALAFKFTEYTLLVLAVVAMLLRTLRQVLRTFKEVFKYVGGK